MPNIIFIGSDHAGVIAKEFLKKELQKKGHTYIDVGTFDSKKSVDYPDIAKKVCKKVLEQNTALGILICGSGTGMQIAANKIKGIRAAMCYDVYSSKLAREHNDANVLCLRARKFPRKDLIKIANIFLKTKFSGELRHKKRIAKIKRLET